LATILPQEVVIKEIQIQASLYKSTAVCHPVVFVKCFVIRSVDPVDNVQGAIDAQKKHVMSG
jgi:hypothetical protein